MQWPSGITRLAGRAGWRRHRRTMLGALLVLSAPIVYAAFSARDEPSYLTAPVVRGNITSLVTATGTIAPIGEVRVGSQLSGQVAELLADFNDHVHKGQPLARLDAQAYEATVREAEAALEMAQANLLMHEAALTRAEAELATVRASRAVGSAETESARAQREAAERELARVRALARDAAISGSELDRAEARAATATALLRAAETQEEAGDAATQGAEAALKMALARLQTAAAEVKRAQAMLQRVTVDLERTTIRSPIDGIVIGRNVDGGQTVAVGLEAPTLFTIASDLRRMEVRAQIDQADIGRIAVGQPVLFAVDAYPEHVFAGTVAQIRKSPHVVQNVVTYTVIVSADNADLLLLPGMTAILRITVMEIEHALRLPSAALRFRPEERTAARAEALAATGGLGTPEQGTPALIWVLDGGKLDARVVGIGSSDGNVAAVLSGRLEPGEFVVMGTVSAPPSMFGLRFGF